MPPARPGPDVVGRDGLLRATVSVELAGVPPPVTVETIASHVGHAPVVPMTVT